MNFQKYQWSTIYNRRDGQKIYLTVRGNYWHNFSDRILRNHTGRFTDILISPEDIVSIDWLKTMMIISSKYIGKAK